MRCNALLILQLNVQMKHEVNPQKLYLRQVTWKKVRASNFAPPTADKLYQIILVGAADRSFRCKPC
jgi:hypothetical protein